jgi:hypothetical protein
MRRELLTFLVGAGLVSTAGTLPAQTLGTPIFMAPTRAFQVQELGGYISDPGEGVSIAIEGEYRRSHKTFDWGLQGGYMDAEGGADNIGALGIDARAVLAKHNNDFPLDAAVTGGFGVLFSGGDVGFLIPLGVSLGRQVLLEESKISFTPYVHPVIAPAFGDLFDDAQFGLGLGVDITLTKTFDVRVSGAVGDYEGVGIGVAWHK